MPAAPGQPSQTPPKIFDVGGERVLVESDKRIGFLVRFLALCAFKRLLMHV
jgi:hypothetical protein